MLNKEVYFKSWELAHACMHAAFGQLNLKAPCYVVLIKADGAERLCGYCNILGTCLASNISHFRCRHCLVSWTFNYFFSEQFGFGSAGFACHYKCIRCGA